MKRIMATFLVMVILAATTDMRSVGGQQNGHVDARPSVEIPKNLAHILNAQVIPALRTDETSAFLESMTKLLVRATPEQLNEMEAIAQTLGIDSLKHAFGERVLNALEQGDLFELDRDLRLPIVVYINDYLIERVQADLRKIGEHAVMTPGFSISADWREMEQLFWEVHVIKNQLANLDRIVHYFATFDRVPLKRAKRKKDERAVALLESAVLLPEQLHAVYSRLLENEAILRIEELTYAADTLRQSEDFETRLLAAFSLETSAFELKAFFANNDNDAATGNAILNAPDLSKRLTNLLEQGRKYGKEVIEKSILLKIGAHWWLRGRYGSAPMAKGLLKFPNAVQSEQAMFGLYMPKERPRPILEPTKFDDRFPRYARRHYYTWAVEYRDMVFTSNSKKTDRSTHSSTPTISGISNTSCFW